MERRLWICIIGVGWTSSWENEMEWKNGRSSSSFRSRNFKMGICRNTYTIKRRSFNVFFHETSKRAIRDSQLTVAVDVARTRLFRPGRLVLGGYVRAPVQDLIVRCSNRFTLSSRRRHSIPVSLPEHPFRDILSFVQVPTNADPGAMKPPEQ